MNRERLNSVNRLNGTAQVIGSARLNGWGIRFDLYSGGDNRCGVTDMVPSEDEYVLGVLYEVPFDLVFAPKGQQSRMDKIEGAKADCTGNYRKKRVFVSRGERTVPAVTYIGTEAGKKRFLEKSEEERRVSKQYFAHLLAGAKQFNFPAAYMSYLRRQAGRGHDGAW